MTPSQAETLACVSLLIVLLPLVLMYLGGDFLIQLGGINTGIESVPH